MKHIKKRFFACLFLQLAIIIIDAGQSTVWHDLAYNAESYQSLDALRAAITGAAASGANVAAHNENGLTAAEIVSAKLRQHEDAVLEAKLTQAIDTDDTLGWSIRKQTLLLRRLTDDFKSESQ